MYGSDGPRPFRDGMLEGKIALVTGGDSGVSRGVCAVLSHLGAEVIMTGPRVGGLDTWFRELSSEGGPVSSLDSDPVRPDTMDELVEEIDTVHGRLDLLVTYVKPDGARNGERDEAAEAAAVAAVEAYCRALRPLLAKSGGAIVNMVDVCCGEADAERSPGAVELLTRRLAGGWARQGVRVCALALGAVDTSAYERCRWEVEGVDKPDVPLGRMATPWEIGTIATFLGFEARTVTGATLVVDGGQSLPEA